MLRGAFAAARSAQIRNISSKFATALDIELVVASPEQDGVTPSARRTTTLFLVKDDHGDVHLAPCHYWNGSALAQPSLFAERADEPAADEALCVMGPGEG